MTDEKTPEISGPLADLALVTITGTGKVTWPDGTEVSADQFQNSVTAATTGFAKGLEAGRQAALLEAAERFTARANSAHRDDLHVVSDTWDLAAADLRELAEPERDEEGR